jgi:hypothetical protein
VLSISPSALGAMMTENKTFLKPIFKINKEDKNLKLVFDVDGVQVNLQFDTVEQLLDLYRDCLIHASLVWPEHPVIKGYIEGE